MWFESVLRNIDRLSTTTERKVVLTTREMGEVSGIDLGKLLFGHDRILIVGGLESKVSEYGCRLRGGGSYRVGNGIGRNHAQADPKGDRQA